MPFDMGNDTSATMAIRVVDFSNGGYKIRQVLPKNQLTQRKLLNFENWVNGEVSKALAVKSTKI